MMLEPWELQIHVKDDLLCHGPRHFGTGKHFGRLGNAATVTADWTFFAHLTPDLPAIAMKRFGRDFASRGHMQSPSHAPY
jgi:hypothetical protein